MEHLHDNPLCASLGHYIGHLTVVWCPHRQEWLGYVNAGDDTDDMSWRTRTLRFGPFDRQEEVESEVVAETLRLLRADQQAVRARLEQRRSAQPTTEP